MSIIFHTIAYTLILCIIVYVFRIKLKPETGIENILEVKGTGSLTSKWFEAEKDSSGKYVLTAKGKREMAAAKAEASKGGSSGSSGSSGGSSNC